MIYGFWGFTYKSPPNWVYKLINKNMLISNPTKNDIEVTIFGDKYFLPKEGELSVPSAVASYWKTNLHSFLIISEDKKVDSKIEVKETEKVIEDDIVTPEEEVVEVKKTKKK